MTPNDLFQLRTVSDPQIHPSGGSVAFVVTQMDEENDGYKRRIWVHDGTTSNPFTAGPADSSPRWSANGSRLALLRATDLKKPIAQLAVMPVDGGEAEVVTHFPLGVEYFSWSPDSRYLCVVAKTWIEGLGDLTDDERSRRPKRILRYPYRFDNRGWLHDRQRQLWLVDPTGSEEPRRLTEGNFDESMPAWHPDSDRIAFVSDHHPRQGLEPGSDVFEVDLEGRLRQVGERGGWAATAYAPDGKLHLLGHPELDYPRLFGLWREESGGDLTPITGQFDRSVFSLVGGGPTLPRWVGATLYTVIEDSGRIELVAIEPDGMSRGVVGGDRVVTGFDAVGDRLVVTVSTPQVPSELVDVSNGGEERLTSFSSSLSFQPRPLISWRTTGSEVDVFVVLPEGEGPFPVLLNIHGGPASQYGFGFFDEFQVYAGAGYAVVACNPRGSSGRGLDYLRAVVGDGWGEVDLADIMGALDDALERYPELDRQRVGIMGGSYGGFMTAWATGHTDRFQSAVVERALTSFPSFEGTSDIGPIFTANYVQSDDLEGKWNKSPLAVADKIVTPTLILHSEEDYRCPIEQAEQLWLRLLNRGIETEMVRFPGEGHELSRSGKPRHRVERLDIILDWHDRHLKT